MLQHAKHAWRPLALALITLLGAGLLAAPTAVAQAPTITPDTAGSPACRFHQGHVLVWLNRLPGERGTAGGQ